jgi:hypothetical protein
LSSSLTKIKKDKKFRGTYKRKELKIVLYKYALLTSKNINYKRFYAFEFMTKFHLSWSKARIINRCIYTGRAR